MSQDFKKMAEESITELTEVHRGWCNYCHGMESICEGSRGKSYQCALIESTDKVAAALAQVAKQGEQSHSARVFEHEQAGYLNDNEYPNCNCTACALHRYYKVKLAQVCEDNDKHWHAKVDHYTKENTKILGELEKDNDALKASLAAAEESAREQFVVGKIEALELVDSLFEDVDGGIVGLNPLPRGVIRERVKAELAAIKTGKE